MKPVLALDQDALGCTRQSPFAPDNPDRTLSMAEAFNSPAMRDTRLSMLRGQTVAACQYCYDREAAGGVSYRQDMNALFRQSIEWNGALGATKADGSIAEEPVYLDLRLGNTCNLRCIMCDFPTSSSLKSIAGPRWLPAKLDPYSDDDNFWLGIQRLLPNLRRIYCAGGEPMLQPAHRRLIATVIESGMAPNIDLVYSSNLTVVPTFDIALFGQFKSVEIGASCDGLGAVYESIRRGARWSDFERNLSLFSQYARIRIAVTPQRDNIGNLADLIVWSKSHNYAVDLTNILQHPGHLSVATLPPSLKETYTNSYTNLACHYRNQGDYRLANELEAIVRTLNTALPVL